MALATLNPLYKDKRVAFGKSAAPLFKRTDIDDIAILALESKDPTLLRLFSKIPDLKVLKKARVDAALKKLPVAGPHVKK